MARAWRGGRFVPRCRLDGVCRALREGGGALATGRDATGRMRGCRCYFPTAGWGLLHVVARFFAGQRVAAGRGDLPRHLTGDGVFGLGDVAELLEVVACPAQFVALDAG